jgi:hypothetical protein
MKTDKINKWYNAPALFHEKTKGYTSHLSAASGEQEARSTKVEGENRYPLPYVEQASSKRGLLLEPSYNYVEKPRHYPPANKE